MANLANSFADSLGIQPNMRFQFLYPTHQEKGSEYIQSMNFSELTALDSLLLGTMQEKVLESLSELLSERLKIAKKSVNSESLKLNGEFYFYLKSLSTVDAGNSFDDHNSNTVTNKQSSPKTTCETTVTTFQALELGGDYFASDRMA